jgi:hypothetical protein
MGRKFSYYRYAIEENCGIPAPSSSYLFASGNEVSGFALSCAPWPQAQKALGPTDNGLKPLKLQGKMNLLNVYINYIRYFMIVMQS